MKRDVLAHIRVRSQEEVKRVSPIERIASKMFWTVRLRIFGWSFAQHSWTLRVTSVSLVYRGATEGDELVDADDAAYDMVDRRLEQFFGAETLRSEHWIQAWANGGDEACGSTISLESARDQQLGSHDESRPPVTRIRDVRYGLEHYNGRKPDTIELTHDGSEYVPIQYIGTIDIRFKKMRGLLRKRPTMMRIRSLSPHRTISLAPCLRCNGKAGPV